VQLWSANTPEVYPYTIEILTRNGTPYEFFSDTIGFRKVRLIDGTIILNNSKLIMKAVRLKAGKLFDEGLKNNLRAIKTNHFNTIVLSEPASEGLLNWCDTTGLYVVQVLTDHSFPNLDHVLQYFMKVRNHPSLILWDAHDLDERTVNILRRLDANRPITKNFRSFEILIDDWLAVGPPEQFRLKTKLQPIEFYYVPGTAIMNITLTDGLRFLEHLNLTWTIKDSIDVIQSGVISNLKFSNGRCEVRLPEVLKKFSNGEFVYTFNLVFPTDLYPYYKSEAVGLCEFSFRNKNDTLIYQRDY